MGTNQTAFRGILALALLVMLGACVPAPGDYSTPALYETRFMPPSDTDVAAVSYAAADRLMNQVGEPLDPSKPILVASLADIDDLERSSAFGRMIGEQLSSRLSQLSYTVVESKLRNTIAINPIPAPSNALQKRSRPVKPDCGFSKSKTGDAPRKKASVA